MKGKEAKPGSYVKGKDGRLTPNPDDQVMKARAGSPEPAEKKNEESA